MIFNCFEFTILLIMFIYAINVNYLSNSNGGVFSRINEDPADTNSSNSDYNYSFCLHPSEVLSYSWKWETVKSPVFYFFAFLTQN